ncbi:unnamed protein product [Vicia faba]|uniref:Uncharacterized protein n=1 Tax=Vicia faba TaxID=3906 RepID=A0AAV0YJD0_VICFA|nr:unnamed protein product [Vicia faba]
MTSSSLDVIDKKLWMKCAGHLPFDPSTRSYVYFFPQGYAHTVGKSLNSELINRLKQIAGQGVYLCQILSISFLADNEYAKIKLITVKDKTLILDQFGAFERGK